MKFTIERAALARALQELAAAVNPGAQVAIVRNVLIESVDQTLKMTTTNLDMWATVAVNAVIAESGQITAEAAKLREIASVTPDGADLYCETEEAPARLKVACGRSRFTVATLPAGDFPLIEADPAAQALCIPAKDLATMLGNVSFAASTEAVRFYLCGVYLHTVDGAARVAATNGHMMAYDERPAPEGFELPKGVLLPNAAVSMIESSLGRAADGAEASILIGETTAVFSVERTTILTKLIDGQYPDYGRLYAMPRLIEAVVDAPLFEGALKRTRIAAADKGRSVRFSFEDGFLKLRGASINGDVAEDEIEVRHDGEEVSFSAPSGQFLDVLDRIRSETVRLNMSGPKDAVQFSPTNDDRARYLVTPNIS